ncbi:putative transposase [Paenibacillus naphthalenovorans]|uniref:Putative transposase n=1 Tax=Paenibacillus naphthalenovorans TaxID=162209 RepID=A0A0U2VFB3_9BACL|nr:putative transposase [Paenibacillus naphthalenovorans]
MQKAYKFRIYPNKKQIQQINKTFGCSRFVYNYFLDKRIKIYEENKETLSYGKCSSILTILKQEKEWLKEVDKFALQNSLKDLDRAYQKFFKEKTGFPKFKSKHNNRQSYRTNYTNNNIEINENKIKLPKLGWVKFAKSREVEGKILNVTISKNPSGKYFASFCCEVEIVQLPTSDNKIGLDLGIKDFVISSNGDKIDNPKHLIKSEQKLKNLQRSLSRKKKGSKNRNKVRIKLAKQHEKISNQRLDFLHKLSTKLISENQVIYLEDLKVKNMQQNERLAKNIADASWSKFRNILEYKAKWYGREVKILDRWFPSSKTCSCCGFKNEKLTLDIREWTCENCGENHDRDINAAVNILQQGLKLA